MKRYELTPVDGRKSFYGKTYVIEDEGKSTLYSYNTPIVSVKDNKIKALWNGWSMTTGRHINAFFESLGLSQGVGKKYWTQIQDGKINTMEELVKALN